jgi:hypothetical protein
MNVEQRHGPLESPRLRTERDDGAGTVVNNLNKNSVTHQKYECTQKSKTNTISPKSIKRKYRNTTKYLGENILILYLVPNHG